MVSVSLLLSSAWNYCPFQNWNLVQFISRWLYKAFYVIFISTALKYCTTVIWSSVCVLWDRHDTWKLKTGSLSGIQRGTGGEKGKKQWECAPRDQGGGKRGGKNRMRRQSHVILPRVKTAFISMKDNLHKFTARYNWTVLLYFRTGSKDWCVYSLYAYSHLSIIYNIPFCKQDFLIALAFHMTLSVGITFKERRRIGF